MSKKLNQFMTFLFLLILITNSLPSFSQSSDSQEKANPALSWTVGFPFKLAGCALSSFTGLIVGGTAGFIRGAVRSTSYVADKIGNEDGIWENLVSAPLAGTFGGIAHSFYGGSLWATKGAWTGLQRPFEYATVQSALEGVPLAVEETVDGASKVFSTQ